MLHELHDFYLPLAEESEVHLHLHVQADLPSVQGDHALLFEAIGNLLSNSIKFTPAGGIVVLRASRVGDMALIEVTDSGPGIPEAEREAIFQRFYRSDGAAQHSGFGLGLSIVAAIVNLHGFTLEVGDSDQGGARLALYCRQTKALV